MTELEKKEEYRYQYSNATALMKELYRLEDENKYLISLLFEAGIGVNGNPIAGVSAPKMTDEQSLKAQIMAQVYERCGDEYLDVTGHILEASKIADAIIASAKQEK